MNMRGVPWIVLLAGLSGIGLPIIAWLARRFERRRMREGQWNDDGPLRPTSVSPERRVYAGRYGGVGVLFGAFRRFVYDPSPRPKQPPER
jgi:hypothetical protein